MQQIMETKEPVEKDQVEAILAQYGLNLQSFLSECTEEQQHMLLS